MKRLIVIVVAVILLLGIGGVVWWSQIPHTPEEQFAAAEKLEKQLKAAPGVGGGGGGGMPTIEPWFTKTVRAYEAVEGRFGKSPIAVKAWRKIAELQEKVAKRDDQALVVLDRVIRDYPTEPDAGSALLEQARLIRKQADAGREKDHAQAVERYKAALGKLEEYRKRFATGVGGAGGGQGDKALMEMGRIWQDGIQDPLIKAIEIFESFCKLYPASPDYPEALFRLATLMEQAREDTRALALYSELLDKFPQCPWADKAQLARGKLLADKLDRPAEAAADFDKVRENNPDSPLGEEAKALSDSAKEKDSENQREGYTKGRYGRAPVDTMMDKPVPPDAHEELFKKQQLDVETYELEVTLTPAEHRMAVAGTMTLVNQGGKKTELLLMLASGLKVSEVSVDGVPAKMEQLEQTWKITPAKPVEAGAGVKIGFKYAGQFAAPVPEPVIRKPKVMAGGTGTEVSPGGGGGGATGGAEVKPVKLRWNPQLALGEDGYALAGGPWYPSNLIGDIFKAEVRFQIDTPVEVAATGSVVERQKAAGEKKGLFGFTTKRPVMGLYFVYGDFVVRHEDRGGIGYTTYLRKVNAERSEKFIATAGDILDLYSQKFGAYPYENLTIIETPLPPFLGGVGPAGLMMLHQTLVGQNQVPTNLLAHELAHQWFGNQVPINMFDAPPLGYSQWLSEGFATYADALYTEAHEGPAALAHHMERYDQLYFTTMVLHPRMSSILQTMPGTRLYRPVVYEKGAIVLHSLRKVMGEDKFSLLLKEYVRKNQDRRSTVGDFTKLAQEIYGADLSWFFTTWLEKTSFAHYQMDRVEVVEAPPVGSGRYVVTLHVLQPEDVVKMPVDVTLEGENKQRQVVTGTWVSQADEPVKVESTFKPVRIILDENNWILKRPGSDHIWPMEKPSEAK